MATVEHDFTDHDQMSIPKPADNIGAAGFDDMMGDAIQFAIEADRRGTLLRQCYVRITRAMSLPRVYWSDDFRDLIEAIEAELGISVETKP